MKCKYCKKSAGFLSNKHKECKEKHKNALAYIDETIKGLFTNYEYKNYEYLKKHNIGNYIKFQQWNGESSGKNPQLFYVYNDGVLCLNTNLGEEIPFNSSRHQRYKNSKY